MKREGERGGDEQRRGLSYFIITSLCSYSLILYSRCSISQAFTKSKNTSAEDPSLHADSLVTVYTLSYFTHCMHVSVLHF